MPEIPNVTERIAELREHKRAKSLTRSPHPSGQEPKLPRRRKAEKANPLPERRIATNYAVIAIYSTLFAALLAQLFLISLLDLI